MPRQKKLPVMRKTARGLAVTKIDGKSVHLGRWGDPAAQAKFDELVARWLVNGRKLPEVARAQEAVTIRAMGERFVAALRVENTDAWAANCLGRIEGALRDVNRLYGSMPAADFTVQHLGTVREAMLQGGKLARKEVNRRVIEIRRAFSWALRNKLVPASIVEELRTLQGLRRGRGRETNPPVIVKPEWVEEVAPHLTSPVRAIVRLLFLTGARPSEITRLTPGDLDRSRDVWRVELASHKTAHHGERRVIVFPPPAQEVLAPFLLRADDMPLFSPAEGDRDSRRRKRAARTTPLWQSHKARLERDREARPEAEFAPTYHSRAVAKALRRAIDAANRARTADDIEPVPHWTPYALRHTRATLIRAEHGLEVAQAVLGHKALDTTQVYAQLGVEVAERWARDHG